MQSGVNYQQPEVDDPLEILKLRKEDAHIFKLPPMTSSEGHTSEDFQELMFRGEMKMFLKGEFMLVYFFNPDKTIYTACAIDQNIERSVVRAKNSSRYFTIKVINQEGIPSFVGLG